MDPESALLLVDIQRDFLPGGALAVTDGDQVVPVANRLMAHFDRVIATQDWHPGDHGSFAANHDGRNPGERIDLEGLEQILWPVHCVQGTPGVDFAPGLRTEGFDRIFYKGVDPTVDSYSAFFDNAQRRSTGLGDYLRGIGVQRLFIMGLATDYCVKFSVLDSCQLGFETYVIDDGCRGVDLEPGDSARALEAMAAAGAHRLSSTDVYAMAA